jgi:preprotein translocase subunit SecA
LTAGLHQAIEAKEGLEITAPNESMTQMSFQSFFRRFRRMGGCTGTAIEAYDELWAIYRLQVIPIPTNRPRQTRYLPAVLHQTQEEKWHVVAREALAFKGSGRPVLIGVRSVISSALLAEKMQALGLYPSVLNALSHADEAEIVAKAGQQGAVTIATNMAGRGTDIKLGDGVVAMGGLHVIVAEINESKRIDRQLAGRCGRQGDPGSVSVHLSLADDLAVAQIPKSVHRLFLRPQAARWAPLVFRWAQWRAEVRAYQRRVGVLRNDDWLASALPFHSGPGRARVAS